MTDFATTLRRWTALGIGVLALFLVATGCDAFTDDDLGDANPQTPSIAEIVTEVRALSTLEEGARKADLLDDLETDGITLFAPENGAFDAIDTNTLLTGQNQGMLTEVLTYHVVPEEIEAGDISDGMTVETLEGDSLRFSTGDGVAVNGASVTNADVDASNGVVHVIDGVLIETVDAVDRADLTPQFGVLRKLIGEAGLTGALRGPGPDASEGLTVFAPTNDALLDALDDNGNGSIDDGEIPSNIESILQYHVLDSVFFAEDVPTSATDVETLEGSDVTVQRSNGTVTVNGNEVAVPDVNVENGVVHGIDAVLIPPS